MEKERVFVNLTRIVLAVIILRCFYLQVIRYPYYRNLSNRNCIRTVETGIPRGIIYDRNMRVLAKDAPSLHLVFVPQDLESPEKEAAIIARIIPMSSSEILGKFKARYSNPYDRIFLKRKLTLEEVALVEENALELPGVYVQEGLVREYTLGKETCHLLGYIGEINEDELLMYRERGFKMGDTIGKDGLEKNYDEILRGRAGGLQVEVDALGKYNNEKVLGRRESVPGNNLVLTIDQTIQDIANEEMSGRRGCVMAMDPRNGQVLALLSNPGFDPDDIKSYLNKDGHPFLNRAIKGTYSPGSVFKIVTETAVLETETMGEYDRVECTGEIEVADRVFHCWKEEGHGWVDINLAFPYSCNVFFGTAGLKVGVSKMLDFASMFDLGRLTEIDLPGEKGGYLPGRHEIDPLNLSIGQGPILITPVQVLSLISTVANGGNIWKPYIVKEILSPDGEKIKEFEPSLRKPVFIKSETIDILQRGLKNVVLFGTGGQARVEGIEVAGKTGTVQRAQRELELTTHGFFVCYAPADSPKIAMVVFLDTGASYEAAAVAGRILKRVLVTGEKPGGAEDVTEAETENVETF